MILSNDRIASVNHPTKSILWFLLTKEAFNSKVRASYPRGGYAD